MDNDDLPIEQRRRYFTPDGRLATYFDPKPYLSTPYVFVPKEDDTTKT